MGICFGQTIGSFLLLVVRVFPVDGAIASCGLLLLFRNRCIFINKWGLLWHLCAPADDEMLGEWVPTAAKEESFLPSRIFFGL